MARGPLGFKSMDCIFLGCMLSISSTAIIIKSFDDLKLKQQKFTSTVTAVLVVEDIIAVLLLVVLSTISVSKTFDGGQLVWSMVKLVFFLIVWFVFGIYLIPTFLRWMRKYMTEETLLLVAVGLCFGMVVMAAKAGFSTALGAFVMGAILAETIEADVIHRLVTPLKNLFSAVFFVSVGMLVQPSVLGQHWLTVLIIAACIIIFKSLAATTGVLLSGKPLKTAVQSGFCFCQIGEFSFIIAGLGLSYGVIDENLYPIIVSVSILTTFVTPYMIKGALPFYNWVEPRLPEKFKHRIEEYSKHSSGDDSSRVSIGLFVRKQLSGIVLHGVILAAISLLSLGLLRPFLDKLFEGMQIPQIWSRLIGLGGTLVLMSPFLWAVAVKNVSRKKIKEMFDTYRFSQAVVIPLLVLRYVIVLFAVGSVIAGYVDIAVGFLMVLVIIVVAVVLFSRRADGFYERIEEGFTKNFNLRQAQASFHIPEGMENEFAMERLRLTPSSPLAGKTLQQNDIRKRYGANIVTIERGDTVIDLPGKNEILMPFDMLTVIGTEEQVSAIRGDIDKESDMLVHDHSDHEMHMYRYHVEAGGPLCGMQIGTSILATKHHVMVIAIERGGDKIVNPNRHTVFMHDDLLWFVSPEKLTVSGFEKKMIEI